MRCSLLMLAEVEGLLAFIGEYFGLGRIHIVAVIVVFAVVVVVRGLATTGQVPANTERLRYLSFFSKYFVWVPSPHFLNYA